MIEKTYATEAEARAAAEVQNDLSYQIDMLELRKLELEIGAMERSAAMVNAGEAHTGSFPFVGMVREVSVHQLMTSLDSFTRRNPGAPIEITLNSEGGSVLDGLALIDYLRRLSKQGHHIRIVAVGLCASMAGVILQAADERVMTPRAWLGIHEISSAVQGTVTIQEDTMKFTKNLQSQIVDLLTAKSALTPARLKTMWARKDAYLSAPEALKLGLIDSVEDLA